MAKLAPLGPVYQAGTLSGNPVAVAAGLATLRALREELPYERLCSLCARLAQGVNAAAQDHGVPMHVAHRASMFTPFFRTGEVHDLDGAKECDTDAHAAFHRGMLQRGIYLPPSQFELCFLSAAHTEDDVDAFVAAAEDYFAHSEQE
jgi:glutamate-1-semialdehyde 2,1-aminomutase